MSIERLNRLWRSACRLAPIVIAIAIAGCGEDELPQGTFRNPIPLAEVPEPVMKAAKKQWPDIEFKDAFQNLEKGGALHSYEIRGRNSRGKVREVRVSKTGEVLEAE